MEPNAITPEASQAAYDMLAPTCGSKPRLLADLERAKEQHLPVEVDGNLVRIYIARSWGFLYREWAIDQPGRCETCCWLSEATKQHIIENRITVRDAAKYLDVTLQVLINYIKARGTWLFPREKIDRNKEIIRRIDAGEKPARVGKEFGLSRQQVYQLQCRYR